MTISQFNSTDSLTRLPDRHAFLNVLPQVISAERKFKSKFGLLIIDIFQFHRINSIYGFRVGDIVLQKLTDLLNSVKRQQDRLFRIGDNRFGLILMDLMNAGHAELAAQKIHRLLIPPFTEGENRIKVDCTIGIMLFPQHAMTPETLLKGAEDLLYKAREEGHTTGIAREQVVSNEISEYWDIELGLRSVIEKHQLQLYYQPQISIDSNLPIGAEALIRWIHPRKGVITPDTFISIAEQTGHITQITNWALNTAMRESAGWTRKWGPLTVSVNIPPDFILRPFLKDFVFSAIKLWGSSNVTLVLEIIERSLIKEPERCFEILTEMQHMGVRISIDDFGTGYSTLSYFKQIPVNELKIDQSFVFDLLDSQANQSIVRLITDLAHSFHMKVVAEGVETNVVKNKLEEYGVDIGQGYYFAKPMPEKAFKEWLLDYKPLL